MAEIVNLNRVRKAKVKTEGRRQAEANRVAFGRTKAAKEADRAAAEKARRDLDGKKIDDPEA